jgi:hypothetical protein
MRACEMDRSNEELQAWAHEHLVYEVGMLVHAAQRAADVTLRDPDRNAFLESFAIQFAACGTFSGAMTGRSHKTAWPQTSALRASGRKQGQRCQTLWRRLTTGIGSVGRSSISPTTGSESVLKQSSGTSARCLAELLKRSRRSLSSQTVNG